MKSERSENVEAGVARPKEILLGHVVGVDPEGASKRVSVYKIGREFRLSDGLRDHLCHPSVRDISKVPAEASLVFRVRQGKFHPRLPK
jgi:hypothetical protein